MDFDNKKIGIFGLQGSGKTYFIKSYLESTSRTYFIYDLGAEFGGLRNKKHIVYVPQFRQGDAARQEANKILSEFYFPLAEKNKVNGLIVDEVSLIAPNKKPLPDALFTVNERNRHIGKGQAFIFAARRPSQINTDMVEIAHNIIIFNLAGKNDRQYLNAVREGAGDASVDMLLPYHFLVLDETRQMKIYKPVQRYGNNP
jgi:hypothetical protein